MLRRRDQHARRRVARLPRVGETALHTLGNSDLKVSVFQQDIRRLAAQFLSHTLDRIGCRLGDHDACTRRAGERNHVDLRMAAHGLADVRAGAIDQVENPGRHARLMQNFGKDDAGQRCDFTRFEHHGATRGNGRRDFADDLVERPVPRRDQRTHADGFTHHTGGAVLFAERERLQRADGRLKVRTTAPDLRVAGKMQRRAHFLADGLDQVVIAQVVDPQNLFQQCQTLTHAGHRKRRESPAGRCHSFVHILGIAHGDLDKGLFG